RREDADLRDRPARVELARSGAWRGVATATSRRQRRDRRTGWPPAASSTNRVCCERSGPTTTTSRPTPAHNVGPPHRLAGDGRCASLADRSGRVTAGRGRGHEGGTVFGQPAPHGRQRDGGAG